MYLFMADTYIPVSKDEAITWGIIIICIVILLNVFNAVLVLARMGHHRSFLEQQLVSISKQLLEQSGYLKRKEDKDDVRRVDSRG